MTTDNNSRDKNKGKREEKRLDNLVIDVLTHGVSRIEERFGLSGINEVLKGDLEKGVRYFVPERIEDPRLDRMFKIWGKNVFK